MSRQFTGRFRRLRHAAYDGVAAVRSPPSCPGGCLAAAVPSASFRPCRSEPTGVASLSPGLVWWPWLAATGRIAGEPGRARLAGTPRCGSARHGSGGAFREARSRAATPCRGAHLTCTRLTSAPGLRGSDRGCSVVLCGWARRRRPIRCPSCPPTVSFRARRRGFSAAGGRDLVPSTLATELLHLVQWADPAVVLRQPGVGGKGGPASRNRTPQPRRSVQTDTESRAQSAAAGTARGARPVAASSNAVGRVSSGTSRPSAG